MTREPQLSDPSRRTSRPKGIYKFLAIINQNPHERKVSK